MIGLGRARIWADQHHAARRRFWMVLLVAVVAAAGIGFFDIKPAVAQSPTITAWRSMVDPGLDPDSAVWDDVPASVVQLTAQNVTPPMSEEGAPWISVAALHFEDVLYVNLQWVDVTADRTTDAVGVFSDAVAIQFPAVASTSVPALCMGQADSAVNIWHWRADTEEGVASIPEHGYVDMYPQVDDLHYPAAAASNSMVFAPAVQNLVAGGFGTLAPLESQVISGGGSYGGFGWSVTMARPFTPPGEYQPVFETGASMDVAVAAWNGANDDRDGQKSVSAFVRMSIDEDAYQAGGSGSASTNSSAYVAIVIGGFVVLALVGGFAAIDFTRRDDDDEREVRSG